MFLTTVYSLCWACLLGIFSVSSATCPINSGIQCFLSKYCSGSSTTGASCVEGYCKCRGSSKYDHCTCLSHVSDCLIKRSPSTYVGFPSSNGTAQTLYSCISSSVNCEYEVHVIANYESSNGRHGIGVLRVAGDTHVQFNINGQSSKPLILVFTSYKPVNWRLSLPSGVAVNRILVSGYYTSTVTVVSGTPATSVEVVPRSTLRYGYGSDGGGGRTADAIVYLINRFGPISSFSGSYRADRWTVNIERSPVCNSSEPPQSAMVRFQKERYTVNEGAGNVTLVLLTSLPNPDNIPVLYSTTDGTARAPMDYTAANQMLVNFPAGYSQFELTIPI